VDGLDGLDVAGYAWVFGESVCLCVCVCLLSVRLSLCSLYVQLPAACTSAACTASVWCLSLATCHRSLDAGRWTLDAGRCTAWPVHATSSGPGGTPRLHPWLWLYLIPQPTTWHHSTTQHQAPWAAGRLGPPNRTETPGCPKARGAAAMFAGNARPSRASHRHVVEANSTRRTVQRRRP
jgi:hypothetical protein